MSDNTCIVVLGMHRSGTSLVAGLLYRMGIFMGDAFRKPDRHNRTGYYEDLDFRDLNKRIINRAGGRWFNPPNEEDIADSVRFYSDRIEALVSTRSGLWGFKDPRTVFTINALEPYLPDDTRIIHVSRNPLEVVASLSRRASIKRYRRTDAHWYRIVTRYREQISEYLADCTHLQLSIGYEDLLYRESAHKAIQSMMGFCGLDWRDEDKIAHVVKLIAFRD